MNQKDLILFNLLEISDTLESLKRRINHLRVYIEAMDTHNIDNSSHPAYEGDGVNWHPEEIYKDE
jgi:hypothetical protein